MKMLNTAGAQDFSSGGIVEARRFGFEMNSFAFHAVIDGIYSNKIEAPVREYATNAYDAHRMVGKDDVPFIMMAPSTFNPYFMVRDFGPGMDHDDVMERATTLFGSNKRDRNDQVGMLGLGMKSAFAYTKQYTITCFDGTEKREYICYIDEGGAPTVSSVGAQPSTEPAGVMIRFPVRQADVYRFQSAIEKVIIGFNPRPQILNDSWKPVEPAVLMTGANYQIVKSSHIHQPHILQGCVLYPLDVTQIGVITTMDQRQLSVIIEVPIGTANVSTSREQLGYDEPTKKNLAQMWEATLDDIREKIQTTLDEPENFLDACIRYRELSLKFGSMMPKELKWREKYVLRSAFPYDGSSGATVRVDVIDTYAELKWSPPPQPRGYRRTEVPKLTPEQLKRFEVLWEAPDCTFAKDRIRMFRKLNPKASVLWVKTRDKQFFTNLYGIEAVHDLRQIERLKLPRAASYRPPITKQDIRAFTKDRRILGYIPEKAVYVLTEGAKYVVRGEVMEFDEVRRKFIDRLNLNCTIIAVVKNQRTMAAEQEGWTSLDDVIKAAVKAFDAKDYAFRAKARHYLDTHLLYRLSAVKELLPARLSALIDEVNQVKPLEAADSRIYTLWSEVTGKSLPEVKITFSDRLEKLLARYPLLKPLAHSEELLTHYLQLIKR